MPSTQDVIDQLEIQLDRRLQELPAAKLVEIGQELIENLDKKSLTSLLSDERYFSLTNMVKWLEKKEKGILMQVLNEPEDESKLKQPVAVWLKEQGMEKVDYEVPLPGAGRGRSIDVCGFKAGLGGRLGTKIIAVETKVDASRGAIDKAFAQAKDNAKGVNMSYVAFSPYVYMKYADVIMEKDAQNKDVGVLIADSMRVVVRVADPEDCDVFENEAYNAVRDYMKSR